MKYFGAHVSASGGVENAVKNAKDIGATAFALFTKNQRQWIAPKLTAEQIANFKEAMAEAGFSVTEICEKLEPHSSFKDLNKNDNCPCKSGKSYKNCCLKKL